MTTNEHDVESTDKVTAERSADKNIDESREKSIERTFDFTDTPTAFEIAISELFVWYAGEGSTGWRVHRDYRDLFACLTPRQIKSFLRERLLASRESGRDHPLVSILSTLFHPIWKVWRDEKALFRSLAISADAAIRLSQNNTSTEKLTQKLTGPAAEFFHRELLAIVKKSSVLSKADVRACWPRKSEERTLLVHLVALVDRNKLYGTSNVQPSDRNSAMEITKASESGMKTEQKGQEKLIPFTDWVYRKIGSRPSGLSVSEQVSSFQDIALAMYRNGNKSAIQAVKEYADTYLYSHEKEFDASIASSLSNLAVLINDFSGAEAQCDHLFTEALRLAKPGSRIPFFFVEFLLDAKEDSARISRIPENNKIDKRIREILDGIKEEHLDPASHLYRDILSKRLEASNTASKQDRLKLIWQLVKDHAGILVQGGREPSSRLNDLLDSLIGKGSANLPLKEPLQCMIWAAQVKGGYPSWSMAVQIANDLVGESTANGEEEKAGIRMNAALVVDPGLLTAGESDRLAAIWSQTGALLTQRFNKAAISRVALAFITSMAYGGGAQSFDRMRQVAVRFGMENDLKSPEDWKKFIEGPHQQLVATLKSGLQSASEMVKIRDAVFGDVYDPIATPDNLADAMRWKAGNYEWADNMSFDKAVAKLLPSES